MATVHEIGTHRMTVEGDWVELWLIGTVLLADSLRLHQVLADVLAANDGRAFMLCDISRMEGLPAETRRHMSAWNHEHRVSAASIHGGSFTIRTLLNLAVKAIKLRDPGQLEAVFHASEEEARRWLAGRRAAVLAEPRDRARQDRG